MKKNTLIVIHSNTYFNELFKLSLILLESKNFTPIILFPVPYSRKNDNIQTCLQNGLTCIDEQGDTYPQNFTKENILETKTNYAGEQKAFPFKNLLLKFLRLLQIDFIFGTIYMILYLKKRALFAKKVITKFNCNLILLGGDLVHYDSSTFIKIGHELGVRSVIVPCTMSNALEMAESYFSDKRYAISNFGNWLAGKLMPEWVYVHKGKKMLRAPADRAFAMYLLKLSPPFPWINNSSYADVIAAESEMMELYYTREGISKKQITITGSPSHDILANISMNISQSKKELCKKFNLDASKPIILSPLVPNQHYLAGGRPECEFQTYEQLVEFWIQSLAKKNTSHTVLINLHPSVKKEDYKKFEHYGLTVTDIDVATLIPLCDLFIASVSSIIRWAIACAKPVLNYDVYKFRYTDYLHQPAVITVEEKKDFQNLLDQFTLDSTFVAQLKQKQEIFSKKWGVLDGKAYIRLLQLFSTLTKGANE